MGQDSDMPRRATTVLAPALLLVIALSVAGFTADTLPATLSDHEFWSLTAQLSEPNGYFVSQSGSPDNLLSNEVQVSTVAATLAQAVKPSGVYLGVGPEQNFSYIAATRPPIAFITDIRRGNLDLHLLYKAVFEMSASRAEFVARLFSRQLPASLPPTSSAAQLMRVASVAAPVDESVFRSNLNAVTAHLMNAHAFPLTVEDLANIAHAYRAFYRFGPAIDYTSSINGRTGRFSSYATIISSVDRESGVERSFLANEQNFALIKTMESKNLIVPIVGDFAGPKALRLLGVWLKARGAHVGLFYVSNVEQYLQRKGVWPAFCANVTTLPIDSTSVFVRPGRGGSPLSPMAAEAAGCGK
ncbi:MAG: hypothetical protein ABI634_09800 [Acidobacteriota bacterium]